MGEYGELIYNLILINSHFLAVYVGSYLTSRQWEKYSSIKAKAEGGLE